MIMRQLRILDNVFFGRSVIAGPRAKESLSRVRKYIRFEILFIPRSSNCKKPFRGFSDILLLHISYESIVFHILTQPKNPEKKYI